MQYLQNEHVLILGLGISGLSMARWCVSHGAVVRVADTRENPSGLQELKQLVVDVDFIAGPLSADLLNTNGGQPFTRVLRSPGLNPNEVGMKSVLEAAKSQEILIQGELGLFYEAIGQIDAEISAQEEAQLTLALEERAEKKAVEQLAKAIKLSEETAEIEVEDDVETLVATTPELEFKEAIESEEQEVSEYVSKEFELGFDLDELFEEAEKGKGSEIEEPLPVVLGYKPKIIGVTGTNGKTTVTSLTRLLIERAGKSVIAAGNIGPAMMDTLSEKLKTNTLPEAWVLELSSFQLDSEYAFNPTVATILNLSQDHLDWHGSMEAYVAAKGHIFGENTVRVLNRNDAQVMNFKVADEEVASKRRKRIKETAPTMVTFGVDEPTRAGDFGIAEDGGVPWLVQALAADETILNAHGAELKLLMPVDVLRIRGRHNASNALAALALATQAGCDIGPMLHGLREYRGEPHRVEFVALIDGVEYIDDSKGTNVGATVAALAGLGVDHKIVLILGGDGKGQDFSPLLPMVSEFVRSIVLIGKDAKVIEAVLAVADVPMQHASSVEHAVELCKSSAQSGDVVLLSPACASLDMFSSYIERSKVFVAAVNEIAENQGQLMVGGAA